MTEAWEQKRPVFARLPECLRQVQVNPDGTETLTEVAEIVDALTLAVDQILVELRSTIDNFGRDYLTPATAKPEALDWLAQLCGFTGEYWDSSWSVSTKRQLIADCFDFIWVRRGSKDVLMYLFNLFDLDCKFVNPSNFIAGVTKPPATLGNNPFNYQLELPPRYDQYSPEFALIKRCLKLYSPAWVEFQFIYRSQN